MRHEKYFFFLNYHVRSSVEMLIPTWYLFDEAYLSNILYPSSKWTFSSSINICLLLHGLIPISISTYAVFNQVNNDNSDLFFIPTLVMILRYSLLPTDSSRYRINLALLIVGCCIGTSSTRGRQTPVANIWVLFLTEQYLLLQTLVAMPMIPSKCKSRFSIS